MLYWLADFSGTISVFNVFRYLTVRTGGSMATAALFVFLFGPWIIDHLRIRQGKGQPIRPDGPKSHLISKAGTPTMGGLMILLGIVVAKGGRPRLTSAQHAPNATTASMIRRNRPANPPWVCFVTFK